jgi:hypothetical protein
MVKLLGLNHIQLLQNLLFEALPKVQHILRVQNLKQVVCIP